jgi:hypothetical protein
MAEPERVDRAADQPIEIPTVEVISESRPDLGPLREEIGRAIRACTWAYDENPAGLDRLLDFISGPVARALADKDAEIERRTRERDEVDNARAYAIDALAEARSALEEARQARDNVLDVLRAEIDLPRRVRADMDAWEANGGKIPPGRYRVHAEINVEQREGYEVLVPGAIQHGKKVGGLLNLGLVLLERWEPLTGSASGRPAAQEAPPARLVESTPNRTGTQTFGAAQEAGEPPARQCNWYVGFTPQRCPEPSPTGERFCPKHAEAKESIVSFAEIELIPEVPSGGDPQ